MACSVRNVKKPKNSESHPKFIYSFTCDTNKLYKTPIGLGKQTCHQLHNYLFKSGAAWTPDFRGNILLTGNYYPPSTGFTIIDPNRDYAIKEATPMLIGRGFHGSVFYRNCLYVIGCFIARKLSQCEKYEFEESKWTMLEPLPEACFNTTVVVPDGSQYLYAIGGSKGFGKSNLNMIQKLSLEMYSWKVLHLDLPWAGSNIACFNFQENIYFVTGNTLFNFNPNTEKCQLMKTLSRVVRGVGGPSYYSEGKLYCSFTEGAARKFEINL